MPIFTVMAKGSQCHLVTTLSYFIRIMKTNRQVSQTWNKSRGVWSLLTSDIFLHIFAGWAAAAPPVESGTGPILPSVASILQYSQLLGAATTSPLPPLTSQHASVRERHYAPYNMAPQAIGQGDAT